MTFCYISKKNYYNEGKRKNFVLGLFSKNMSNDFKEKTQYLKK